MTSALVACLFAPILGSHFRRETPNEVKMDMDFRREDSFGNTALTPPCAKVDCGEYSCPAPFELKTDSTCCGYCWAPDNIVAADRHKVTEFNATGHVVQQCEGAPSSCRGPGANLVRCFKPQCRAGETPNCAPGSCCPMCSGR